MTAGGRSLRLQQCPRRSARESGTRLSPVPEQSPCRAARGDWRPTRAGSAATRTASSTVQEEDEDLPLLAMEFATLRPCVSPSLPRSLPGLLRVVPGKPGGSDGRVPGKPRRAYGRGARRASFRPCLVAVLVRASFYGAVFFFSPACPKRQSPPLSVLCQVREPFVFVSSSSVPFRVRYELSRC